MGIIDREDGDHRETEREDGDHRKMGTIERQREREDGDHRERERGWGP